VSCFFNFSVWSQNQYPIDSLSEIYQVLDTVETKLNHYQIKALWLDDTIEIRKLSEPVKYDLKNMRKAFKDSTFNPTKKDRRNSVDFTRQSAQNCLSYALERYFLYHNLKPDSIFDENTFLGRESGELIIDKSFTLTFEASTKRKRKAFKKPIKDGVLVIFRNQYDWIIHAFYYEKDIFYSKNGIRPIKEYHKMKNIFNRYFDTTLVQFYELDDARLNEFLD